VTRIDSIAGYFDETGHPCDPARHFFGLAGFLGKVDSWNKFAEKWEPACAEFYPFHMKDFMKETFHSRERREPILTKLIDVISESEIVPIAAFCHVCDFKRENKNLTDAQGKEIYAITLNHMFAQVGISVLGEMDEYAMHPARTSIVFADRQSASKACDVWWEQKASGEGPIAGALSGIILSSVSIATPDAVPPLQAADLLAWEVGHDLEQRAKKGKDIPFRKSYQRLRDLPAVVGVAAPSISMVHPSETAGNVMAL